MATRSRIRRRIDLGRLRAAVSGPNVDTRTWISMARVDDDEDAIRWDDALGWIADVTMAGGSLDQEGPIACRVTGPFVGNAKGSNEPVTRGQLVLVTLPEGDLNAAPVIVGALFTPDLPVPSSVNGIAVDEDVALATHILVTEHDVQQQVGQKWRTSATSRATLEAPEVRLATEDAAQSFVLGNDQATALKDAFDAIGSFAQSLATATGAPPNAALTVASVLLAYNVLAPKLVAAKTAIDNALSTKIKGS